MCGRIMLISPVQALMREFQLAEAPDLHPRYNIAPGQDISAVVHISDDRQLQLMHWGMTPLWSRPDRPAQELINARSETVRQKPVFSASFAERRCLIPVDAFYEWQRRTNGNQPFLFRAAKGGLLALAGIWMDCKLATGDLLRTCAILTTTANGTMLPVHDRMPVILPEASWQTWLGTSVSGDQLEKLFQPVGNSYLACHPVTRQLGRPDFDRPECLEPLETDPQQGNLFG